MKKMDADEKLITALTGSKPLDLNRRENGDLVFLNQAGQKFIFTDQDIKSMTDKAIEKKEAEINKKSSEEKPKSKSKFAAPKPSDLSSRYIPEVK